MMIYLDTVTVDYDRIEEYFNETGYGYILHKDSSTISFYDQSAIDAFNDAFPEMNASIINTTHKVYIDLDGVMSNFSKRVCEIMDITYIGDNTECETLERGQMWKGVSHYDRNVQPFFESLELIDGALEMYEFIKRRFKYVSFLTATGRTPDPSRSIGQKVRWVRDNVDSEALTITVFNSEQKSLYAKANNVLIDDRSKSIDPWEREGGIGILHTDPQSTIDSISKILKS